MWPCFLPFLFFSPHPWASVCIPSPELPVSSSISFYSVPWLPCGHSVRCVCLPPSAICFPDQERKWGWVLAKPHACTHLQIHVFVFAQIQTHMQGLTDTCVCTNESMLVLKTPTGSEINMRTSGLEENRKWVVRESYSCWLLSLNVCTQKSDLWCKQSPQQISRQHDTSDVCKCKTLFMLLPCALLTHRHFTANYVSHTIFALQEEVWTCSSCLFLAMKTQVCVKCLAFTQHRPTQQTTITAASDPQNYSRLTTMKRNPDFRSFANMVKINNYIVVERFQDLRVSWSDPAKA